MFFFSNVQLLKQAADKQDNFLLHGYLEVKL